MYLVRQPTEALEAGRCFARRAVLLAVALAPLAATGCAGSQARRPTASEPVSADDSAFTLDSSADPDAGTPEPTQIVYELSVIQILVPREGAESARKIWSFLREDALDAETQLRLRKNGVRVGVGRDKSWGPIKDVLESIEGCETTFAKPIRMPIGFVLSLELDNEPREQTLFFLDRDGYLSGSTIPASRNVLRISYAPDPHDYRSVQLVVTPEVYRRREGWEWVRREAGLTGDSSRSKHAYDAVGFVLTLAPGEFALAAPSENADIYGLLGGVFLTRTTEGRAFDSYIFLRPEAKQAEPHD